MVLLVLLVLSQDKFTASPVGNGYCRICKETLANFGPFPYLAFSLTVVRALILISWARSSYSRLVTGVKTHQILLLAPGKVCQVYIREICPKVKTEILMK